MTVIFGPQVTIGPPLTYLPRTFDPYRPGSFDVLNADFTTHTMIGGADVSTLEHPCVSRTSHSDTTFHHFPDLPVEIRLKIWHRICLLPKNIDLWTEFQKCEIEDTIFYTQLYERKLSSTAVPAILHVSREAREVGLKHYEEQFRIDTPMIIHPSHRKLIVSHPGFHFNAKCTRLIPRGFYNMVAMIDFILRVGESVESLAFDITGEFYRGLLRDYLEKGDWPFPSVREVVLYNAKGYDVFKPKYKGGRVTLDFVDSDPSIADANIRTTLENIFASIAKKSEEADGRLQRDDPKDSANILRNLRGVPINFIRPRVRWMELVVS